MTRWKIRKTRVYDRDTRQWTQHLAWALYFGDKRVAQYRSWQRCIEHIQSFYNKFGDR